MCKSSRHILSPNQQNGGDLSVLLPRQQRGSTHSPSEQSGTYQIPSQQRNQQSGVIMLGGNLIHDQLRKETKGTIVHVHVDCCIILARNKVATPEHIHHAVTIEKHMKSSRKSKISPSILPLSKCYYKANAIVDADADCNHLHIHLSIHTSTK